MKSMEQINVEASGDNPDRGSIHETQADKYDALV